MTDDDGLTCKFHRPGAAGSGEIKSLWLFSCNLLDFLAFAYFRGEKSGIPLQVLILVTATAIIALLATEVIITKTKIKI